ncbi:bridge-like lipid transfer protein family member 3B isoform X3 [Neocloeon triangulifer]|uniref:bridge-like lipid transfer protein family member 3B isoform X3 n=1 Tax=Neocloeon triangulifer TaxID=2078957 RepID=UPI00286F6531|nr:bridge-like lipid transfer protein family member 3B isoform X3 [Neocloeon triangulifer]
MVTLIKNQIFKHLSRFTKNLSPDRINLSTLKGEGELTNLELDENVLTDLLELPSWLRLTSAWCNRVCFRIQWTHIKTVPIVLRLDEVQVVIETCPDLRSMSANQGLSSMSSGRYSFIHKVIDGMTITVNAVLVTFKSPAFVASVQVSRIVAESKTPTWKRHDLRMTRVKDTVRGEILLFKEVEWQTVRIEAKSTENPTLTPLRLLTNQARCRITIKKRLSDCFVLGSRLVLILEDLLWVLTDSQLRAALYFVESLSDLVQKATDISRKRKAARKIEMLPEYQAWISQQARQQNTKKSAISKVFSQCDVIETSFHFLSEQIDLHLCDDEGDGRSSHPHLKDGGAFQIRLHHFKVDFYPYHLSLSDRKHWPSYEEDIHAQWLEQTLSTFTANFMEAMDSGANTHTRLSRAEPHDDFRLPGARGSTSSDPQSPNGQNAVKDYVVSHLAKLMSSCVVLRLEDVTLYKVSTTTRKQAPKEFISTRRKKRRNNKSGDKELYKLPDEMSLIHAEFTYFYYPDDIPFPLPPPQFYVYCNPVQIHFDMLTVLWLQSFGLYLLRTLSALTENAAANTNNKDIFNIDVRIEAIMPRIILAESASHEGVNSSRMQRDRPQYLQLQSSKATITNIRSRTVGSRADLATCLNDLQQGELFFNSGFPTKEGDRAAVVERLLRHVNASDNLRRSADLSELTLSELSEGLSRELFWVDAKDIWFVQLDPAWAEFTGMKSSPNKPVPLMDALPITLWLCMTENKNIHAVAHIPSLVSVQLNHYQFLFISRLLDEVSEMTTFLQMDSKKITGEDSGVICVGAALPQVEVTFVMPAHSHAKESFDLDSVIPDSSSLADIPNIPITPPKNPYEIKETDSAVIHGDVFFEETSLVADAPTAEPLPVESHSFKMSNFSTFSKGLASGFSTLITSFDSTKTGDDGLDNMSVRSDGSSDSERYVVVNLEQQNRTDILNAMFVIPAASRAPRPIIDEASEVVEDPDDLSQHSEMSILRRSDPVSVTTLKLSRVEAIYQSQGFKSALRVQCSGISSDECGSIPWDEFQSKFSSRTRAWCDERELGRRCSIKARLERAPDTEPEPDMFNKTNVDSVIRQLFTENLGAEISNVNLSMSLVSVSGLADLLNDEIMPKPVPMEILMENVQLHLSEDRSAVSQLASANNMPINVCISKLKVSRTASGAFFIEPSENSGSSTSPTSTQFEVEVARKKASEMTRENEELRRRLLAAERLHAEEKMKLSSKIDELQGERMALEVSLRKMQLTQAATQSSNQSATPASAKASQQTPLRR